MVKHGKEGDLVKQNWGEMDLGKGPAKLEWKGETDCALEIDWKIVEYY